ncbi:MAG: tetratricopeptide repeat protein [Hyphomonadaceae bacterium]
MRSLAAFLIVLLFSASAHAQSGWRMTTPSGRLPASGLAADANWNRCTDASLNLTLEESLAACDRLLESRPGHRTTGGVHWYRAMRYYDHGLTAEGDAALDAAATAFGLAIRADPRDAYGYSNRAAVFLRRRQFDAALADYDTALSMNSRATWAHLGRGGALFRMGDYAGASEAYDHAGRLAAISGESSPSLHAARCAVRAAMRADLDRGWTFCNRGVRTTDDPSYPLTARGYFQFMRGNLDAALADFTRAYELNAFNASALYGRGVVAVRQGRVAEGEADMTRAREIDLFELEFYANAGLAP